MPGLLFAYVSAIVLLQHYWLSLKVLILHALCSLLLETPCTNHYCHMPMCTGTLKDDVPKQATQQLMDSMHSYAAVQYCRVSMCIGILRDDLAMQATQQLMDSMPSYAEVTCSSLQTTPPPNDSPMTDAPSPLWLSDVILGSRMQFLMSVLPPCLPVLPQVCATPCPLAHVTVVLTAKAVSRPWCLQTDGSVHNSLSQYSIDR